MMDRMTTAKDFCTFDGCFGRSRNGLCDVEDECTSYAIYERLKYYEDLAEAGRMMIFSKDYNMEKFKKDHCPESIGLKEFCHEDADCDECWEAALKERESE